MTETAEPVCKFEEGCHRVVACEPGCAVAAADLRDRIADAIHSDLTTHGARRDQGLLGIVPRLTDAVLAVLPAPADQAAVRDERVEQAEAAIARVLEFAASLDKLGRQLAGPDAVHPVAAHIRHLLAAEPDDGLCRMADEAQQPGPDRCSGCRYVPCGQCGPEASVETQATPCGPMPDACDDEAGEPCANHEREQAHAEGEHCFCGPDCDCPPDTGDDHSCAESGCTGEPTDDEAQQPETQAPDFVTRVLELFSLSHADLYDGALFWRVDDGTVHLSANVSDVFAWGGADCEPITPDTLPVLDQAYTDLKAIDAELYMPELYAARQRGERPQGAAYPDDKTRSWREVSALFDACGPERELGLGNPKAAPAHKEQPAAVSQPGKEG